MEVFFCISYPASLLLCFLKASSVFSNSGVVFAVCLKRLAKYVLASWHQTCCGRVNTGKWNCWQLYSCIFVKSGLLILLSVIRVCLGWVLFHWIPLYWGCPSSKIHPVVMSILGWKSLLLWLWTLTFDLDIWACQISFRSKVVVRLLLVNH